jgi:hypothetical protein
VRLCALGVLAVASCGGGGATPDSGPGGGLCPSPTAGASAAAAAANVRQIELRAAMGAGCATIVNVISLASEKHCAYYSANAGNATCTGNAHAEVASCPLFYGASYSDRMTTAGYAGSPAFETMAFGTQGAASVQVWVDSVWHRTPVLSPWVRDVGYGETAACATMDFGVGAPAAATIVATYPYDGQTGVPTSFSGNEGPAPPAPPGGFPSGYPIHIFIKNVTITSHTLTKDGDAAPIAHVWLPPGTQGLLYDAYVMYANTPLAAATRYRVTVSSGAGFDLTWTFTTK